MSYVLVGHTSYMSIIDYKALRNLLAETVKGSMHSDPSIIERGDRCRGSRNGHAQQGGMRRLRLVMASAGRLVASVDKHKHNSKHEADPVP